jgi:hypothetical protein
VTWTINVKNLGPGEATGVEMSAFFGSDALPLSAEASQGTCSAPPPIGGGFGLVSFSIGSIASGETFTATIVAQVFGGDGSQISVTVSSSSKDPVTGNNETDEEVDIIPGPRPTPSPLGTFCAPVGGIATGGGGTARVALWGLASVVLLAAAGLLSVAAQRGRRLPG